MTMVTNTFQLSVNAKPEAVFAYVSDLTRHGEWNTGLKIVPLGSGPVGVGSQYRTQGEVLNQKDRPNELRVTHYESPTHFAFIAKDPDFNEVTHDFTFKPVAGGTLMERMVTVNLPPLVALAFRTIIHPLVGKPSMAKSFAVLKSKLEQKAV